MVWILFAFLFFWATIWLRGLLSSISYINISYRNQENYNLDRDRFGKNLQRLFDSTMYNMMRLRHPCDGFPNINKMGKIYKTISVSSMKFEDFQNEKEFLNSLGIKWDYKRAWIINEDKNSKILQKFKQYGINPTILLIQSYDTEFYFFNKEDYVLYKLSKE